MLDFQAPNFLRRVLWLDAAISASSAVMLTVLASPLASILQLPSNLLFYSGLSMFPIAAFIAFVGTRADSLNAGVWLVIIGNAAWALASLALLTDQRIMPNALGTAFIVIQAAAVAILAELEYTGLKKRAPTAAA